MNIPLLLLALATFATGTAENIVIGILPEVASGLGVSIGLAGQLTAVFSVTFALAAPAALQLTGRIDRKPLLSLALCLFVVSNLAAAASPAYGVLLAARCSLPASAWRRPAPLPAWSRPCWRRRLFHGRGEGAQSA